LPQPPPYRYFRLPSGNRPCSPAQQNETVIALIDQIIPATDTPGAKAAQVNRYMDLLLKDGPAVERERFMKGLSWFENDVQQKHKTAFSKLPPASRRPF
jgi:hypothetical protein